MIGISEIIGWAVLVGAIGLFGSNIVVTMIRKAFQTKHEVMEIVKEETKDKKESLISE